MIAPDAHASEPSSEKSCATTGASGDRRVDGGPALLFLAEPVVAISSSPHRVPTSTTMLCSRSSTSS